MRLQVTVSLLLLLKMHMLHSIVGQQLENGASLEEQLKYVTSKLNTISAQHSVEIAAMRKEMNDLREEIKSCTSCNEKRNSQLTLEWAKDTVAELRREMRELEAANNASGWQQDLRNEVATILAEAEGVTKLAAADGARLAAGEARHAELMLDVRQVRDIATSAKVTCDTMDNNMKKLQSDLKTQYRVLSKKLHLHTRDEYPFMDKDIYPTRFSSYKIRHMHSIRGQIETLKHDNHKIYIIQKQMKSHMKTLESELDSMKQINNAQNDNKLQEVFDEHEKHSEIIQNITSEVTNFNKLRASVLELLENMETLENKVDKIVPDFRKEISKLEIDVAQIRSHNSYLKDDQKNIRQSMKAIAVSVSNLVSKVDEDHSTLNSLTSTVKMIENRTESEVSSLDGNSGILNDAVKKSLPWNCNDVVGLADIYLIAPGDGEPLFTKCDNGWTLIQNRFNGSVDFNRKYIEYAKGFGTPLGEFWIGNDALHRLTSDNCSSLRIDMLDLDGKYWRADYEYFYVGSKDEGYKLNITGFNGNVSNALEYQNGMQFSAIDEDRDTSKNNCANSYEGGWWFSHCQHANLNGKYAIGLSWFNAAQNEWIALTSSRMMVHKRDKCDNSNDVYDKAQR